MHAARLEFLDHGPPDRQAADGERALKVLESTTFDVAFIDIGLPDIDGFEVARKVNGALGAASPLLVALSGFGRLEDRERAIAAGFHHHLTKPASSTDLKRLLSHVDAPREARVASG